MKTLFPVVWVCWLGLVGGTQAASTAPQIPSDWNLYMMKLVNRARTDPVGEDLRQGTSYNESPAQPLAYNLLVGRTADNHSQWMGLNRALIDDGLANNPPPDSFSHYETTTGVEGGPTGSGSTLGWTGDGLGERLNDTAYAFSNAAENIITWSATRTVNKANLDADHGLWWGSSGHRHNMMNNVYTAFGHATYNDPSGADRRYWTTQNFATPLSNPKTYLFGVVYDDKNNNEQWDPYNNGDADRESLAQVDYKVYMAGSSTLVGSGQTFDNGAFAFNVGDGVYDLAFDLPTYGPFVLEDVTVAGANVDAGDLALPDGLPFAGDFTRDGSVEQEDLTTLLANWGRTTVPTVWQAPFDGLVDQSELNALLADWGSGVVGAVPLLDAADVPEPASMACMGLFGLLIARRRGK